MAWKPPADAIEWTPPEDAIPFNEDSLMMPGDQVETLPPTQLQTQREAAQNGGGISWGEALFPRSYAVADQPAYSPQALDAAWRDVLSAPGRAYASLTRPEGETYKEALSMTGTPEDATGAWAFTDQTLRDPLLAPSLAAPAARVPAWLARTAPAWLRGTVAATELAANTGSLPARVARAGAQATPGGALIAGLSQSERMARGEALDPVETGVTFAAAPVAAGLGPLLQSAGRGSQSVAGKYLTTVIKPTDKARNAGWNPDVLLSELAGESRVGYVPVTLGGMRKAAQEAIDTRAAMRGPAIAADEAAALTQGITPRVNLRKAAEDAARVIDEQVGSGRLTGAVQSVPSAQRWLNANLLPYGDEVPALISDYVPIENALAARQGLDQFAFVQNAPATTAARKVGAKEARREINRQLDVIAPRTRAVDARLAPLLQNAEGLGVVGDRRMNNMMLNPADVLTGAAVGGATESPMAAITAAIVNRTLRSPAPASIMYMGGRGLEAAGRAAGRRPSLASLLYQSQTDNARGR